MDVGNSWQINHQHVCSSVHYILYSTICADRFSICRTRLVCVWLHLFKVARFSKKCIWIALHQWVHGLKSGKIFNRSSGPLELEALCGSSQKLWNTDDAHILAFPVSDYFQLKSFTGLRMMNTKYLVPHSRKHSLRNSTSQQRKQTNFRPNNCWLNQ